MILVWVASIAIGYVVEVARASERTLARALEIEAATRERERLARDIHDSVLQVLAMVQRRGAVMGGEAAELGRMAGEQEVALRTLVSGGLTSVSRVSRDAAQGRSSTSSTTSGTMRRRAGRTAGRSTCARCSPRTPRRRSPSSSPVPPSRCPRPPRANWPRPSGPPWTTSTGTPVSTRARGSSSRTSPTR